MRLKVKRVGLDLKIEVPKISPDTINAVLAVEFNSVPVGNPARLIFTNVSSNVLRALDAKVSDGVEWGDGNRNQNYAWKWKTMDGSVIWDIRITKKSTFNLLINYEAPGESKSKLVEGYAGKEMQNERKGSGGIYQVAIGDQVFYKEVVKGGKQDEQLGEIMLDPGNYKIIGSAKEITGEELFRLTSISLIPKTQKRD
jgi:hypothetical protein